MKISKGDVTQYLIELKQAKQEQLDAKYSMNHEVIKNEVMSYLKKDIEQLEEARSVILKLTISDILSTHFSGMTGSYLQSVIYDLNGASSAEKLIEKNIMSNLTKFEMLASEDDKDRAFQGIENEELLEYISNVWDPIRTAYHAELKESRETLKELNRLVGRARDGYDAVATLKSMGLDTSRAIQIFQERKEKSKQGKKHEVVSVPKNIEAFAGLPKIK